MVTVPATLTPSQACERLQVSRRTLQRYVKAEKLTAVRVTSRTVRYDPNDIDRLLGEDQDLAVVKLACSIIATEAAERERTLCSGCGKRWAQKAVGLCSYCTEAAEAARRQKREWWQRNQPQRVTVDGKRQYVKKAEAAS